MALPEPVNYKSFEIFFEHDYLRLVRFLITSGFDFDTAEDAAQQAMIAALQQWDRIDRPQAWVRTVARRAASLLKARILSDSLKAKDSSWAVAGGNVSDQIVWSPEQQALLDCIGRLPPKQRETISWYLDGFSHQGIAKQMNCPEATVRSNFRHACRQLRRWLKDGTSNSSE